MFGFGHSRVKSSVCVCVCVLACCQAEFFASPPAATAARGTVGKEWLRSATSDSTLADVVQGAGDQKG